MARALENILRQTAFKRIKDKPSSIVAKPSSLNAFGAPDYAYIVNNMFSLFQRSDFTSQEIKEPSPVQIIQKFMARRRSTTGGLQLRQGNSSRFRSSIQIQNTTDVVPKIFSKYTMVAVWTVHFFIHIVDILNQFHLGLVVDIFICISGQMMRTQERVFS